MESANPNKPTAPSATQTPPETQRKTKTPKVVLSAQALQAKRESDRRRAKTRVNIGRAFQSWRQLRLDLGVKTDPALAFILLESYIKRFRSSLTSTGMHTQEPTAISSLGHVPASERGNQLQQDDAEHQSEITYIVSHMDCLQDSSEEMESTIDEDECNSEKNRLSDLDSDKENVIETTELSAPEADDSCDEGVYIPTIPQSSTKSEFLLECEEEELEPWQKETSHVQLKDEEDNGVLSNDQTDCKPETPLLQRNAASSSPPELKTETPQPLVIDNQFANNTEFIGCLWTRCHAGN